MDSNKVLNAEGLACPMPVVKAKKEMDNLKSGEVLEIRATDKGAASDIPAWTKSSGHELLEQDEENDILTFWIKKS
ncbi:TusA-related sulfurtransferase [Salibacterium salarium]|uniref:Sulfurtransferase TusA family protein n=1 Tax=Salibacterium salarium TaxID=284579 RepID=A0A428MTA3_9BACI|nr:sulfurtransferase TusA family protein [Salibacterium salarium]MDQ0297602.1 TusA-related sulfurtransferase [Salibacterium salarium]RSL29359.1 sulfurtransferase TusA family protein [Salibacterium salarium]